jgi:hypothetical protein
VSGAIRIFAFGLAIVASLTMLAPTSAQTVCSVLDNRPCTPTFCSVFNDGPCVPDLPFPFGDGLRLTVQSQDDAAARASDQPLDTIQALFGALRACWIPPPVEQSRPGTQITIRFSLNRAGEVIGEPRYTYATPSLSSEVKSAYQEAIAAALRRCTPFRLSGGLGGAIAGRPISTRFIDNRGLRTEKPQ